MTEKDSINWVVARNLAYWMRQREITSQTVLADKAGVSQKTISNYLNPDQRSESSTGKQPSAKLAELESIAKALRIEVWQLLREMSESERAMHEAIEKAYAGLLEALPAAAGEEEARKNEAAVQRHTRPARPLPKKDRAKRKPKG